MPRGWPAASRITSDMSCTGKDGPVLAQADALPLPHAEAAELFRREGHPVGGRREVARVHAQHLVHAVAVHGRFGGVGVQDAAADVGDGDAELHGAHRLLEAEKRVRGALPLHCVAESAGEELRLDRPLDQVFLGAGGERRAAQGFVVAGGEHHHRHVTRGRAEGPHGGQAGAVGEVEVGQDGVEAAARHCVRARGGGRVRSRPSRSRFRPAKASWIACA